MNSFWNCGCGDYEPDEEELDEIIREIEEEREAEPILIPVTPDEGIIAPDVFRRVERRETVEVE
jgi:hypothetical protein